MSWQACAFVKEIKESRTGAEITRLEKFVLLILADSYNPDKGYALPSGPCIAEWALMSVRQVWRIIKSLEKKEVIGVERHKDRDGLPVRGKPNFYRIIGLDCVTPCHASRMRDTRGKSCVTNPPANACHSSGTRAPVRAQSLSGGAAPLTGAPPADQPTPEDDATREAHEEFDRAWKELRDRPSQ